MTPADPIGKCFFNILATFAGFEVDLLRMRIREGTAIARAKGNSRASRQSWSDPARAAAQAPEGRGAHDPELAELFSVSRATVYRELARKHPPTRAPSR